MLGFAVIQNRAVECIRTVRFKWLLKNAAEEDRVLVREVSCGHLAFRRIENIG